MCSDHRRRCRVRSPCTGRNQVEIFSRTFKLSTIETLYPIDCIAHLHAPTPSVTPLPSSGYDYVISTGSIRHGAKTTLVRFLPSPKLPHVQISKPHDQRQQRSILATGVERDSREVGFVIVVKVLLESTSWSVHARFCGGAEERGEERTYWLRYNHSLVKSTVLQSPPAAVAVSSACVTDLVKDEVYATNIVQVLIILACSYSSSAPATFIGRGGHTRSSLSFVSKHWPRHVSRKST